MDSASTTNAPTRKPRRQCAMRRRSQRAASSATIKRCWSTGWLRFDYASCSLHVNRSSRAAPTTKAAIPLWRSFPSKITNWRAYKTVPYVLTRRTDRVELVSHRTNLALQAIGVAMLEVHEGATKDAPDTDCGAAVVRAGKLVVDGWNLFPRDTIYSPSN